MAHEGNAQKSWVSRICYAIGNLGQAAYYNALSTFFVTYYAAQTLFRDYEDSEAKAMIAVITALVFIIRIAEIFIDPLLGNLVDNTTSRFGRFKPWQVIGGVGSSILLFAIFTGLFGLVNVNKGVFIVVFVIVFVVLDILYSLRDISYWGMIPALSSSSQERSVYTALGTFTGSIGYNGVTAIVGSCGWILRCSLRELVLRARKDGRASVQSSLSSASSPAWLSRLVLTRRRVPCVIRLISPTLCRRSRRSCVMISCCGSRSPTFSTRSRTLRRQAS